MSEAKAEFVEIGKVVISDKRSVVVSAIVKEGVNTGININNYVTAEKYTGYSKGVFVPADKVAEFAKLINTKVE